MITETHLQVVTDRVDEAGMIGYSIEAENHRRVAYVWPYQTEVEISGEVQPIAPFGAHSPELLAKAMAAAPEMLEVLTALLHCCELNLDDLEPETVQFIERAQDIVSRMESE